MCVYCDNEPKVIGEFFGYHECCVNSFVNHAAKFKPGNISNLSKYQKLYYKLTEGQTAFMPCPKHAKQIVKGKIKPSELVSNRICSTPFPITDDNTIYELEDWLEKR